jgi:pimeloyl-ACP methyl ester carboxylesterase
VWVTVPLVGLAGCLGVDPPTPPPPISDASTPPYPEISGTDPWKDRLGQHTLGDRGLLLGCAHVATLTRAEVSQNPLFPAAVGPPANGYELFVMQYVSEGRSGVASAMTALLYLPSGGPADVPIVALGHGTFGIGPECGPSHLPIRTDTLAVGLVGRGYAVVAPDYAGAGVDNGMTSYLVGASEAAATLDAVRAIRTFHDPRFDAEQLGTDFFLAGHSQGGHAALFTHQLFDPSIGVRLLGSIAFAPALGSARAWSEFFKGPSRPVGGMEMFALMSLYTRMLYSGSPEPGAWLSPTAQATVPTLFHDQCLSSLIYSVPADYPTLGDLYQPSFLAASEGCTFEGKCPSFEPWASSLVADEPGRFTSNVPSLILQGLSDVIVPPSTVACIVDRMTARGTPVQACGYPGADHLSIVTSALPDMIRWIDARRAGGTPDVCPAPLGVACPGP